MGPEHQEIQGLTFFVSKQRGSDLERLTEFIESGRLTPSIDQISSLDEVPEAMRRFAAGKARGKIAITV
jgi:NADPH:quinone reductase-like Zn-dependent oxidoreductase